MQLNCIIVRPKIRSFTLMSLHYLTEVQCVAAQRLKKIQVQLNNYF